MDVRQLFQLQSALEGDRETYVSTEQQDCPSIRHPFGHRGNSLALLQHRLEQGWRRFEIAHGRGQFRGISLAVGLAKGNTEEIQRRDLGNERFR